jgi:hypothetical protein
MGFDIMSLQKGRGPVQARSKADEGRAVLKYIDVEDLVPSEDNFYSMSNIEELAGLIELSGGVKQPGLVVPLGGGKYKLLSGHRRRLASLQLVKQGKEAYRKMPCMVEDAGREQGPEADELRAIDEAILLITTNGQREKTGKDKVEEATRLRELLERKRKFENIPGEARKIIAEWMGTTPAQVGRYDSIAKHLIPAFKTWLEEEKINISVAYELSTMSEREQLTALDRARAIGRGPSIDEVKRLREELRTPEPPKAERTEPKPAEDGQEYKPGAYVRTEPTKMTTVPPDGKIVDFPAPVSPPPVEDAPPEETGREQEKDIEWAALMLKTLRNYCETMAAVKGGQTVPWAEYAEAVGIAIAALRK